MIRNAVPILVISGLLISLNAQETTRLIVRGDDMGMTEGSLEAFEKAFVDGVLTCGGILVPGPWFEGAAKLCVNHLDWCVGVHLAVVGEWRGCRWRPVLPWDRVKSLVDEDGFFYASPSELLAHHPNLDELDAEYRAQIDLAKKKGIRVQYLDLHYFEVGAVPGLDKVLVSISRDYGLPVSGVMGERDWMAVYNDPPEQKEERAIQQLDALNPGLTLWVAHIGIDSPEQNALIHSQPEDVMPEPGVGKHRAAELAVVTSQKVKTVIRERGIRLVNYCDLAK
jgi:chitin disaccharide deacetylase